MYRYDIKGKQTNKKGTFFTQTAFLFFPYRNIYSVLRIKRWKKEKDTPDWDFSHMLTYCWKLFRYCGDSWSNYTCRIQNSRKNIFPDKNVIFHSFVIFLHTILGYFSNWWNVYRSWYPREAPFTHGRNAKISEKFPSPQDSRI